MKWRPLETAPLTEITADEPTWVLLWLSKTPFGNSPVQVGYVVARRPKGVRPMIAGWVGDFGVTHWAPLPKQPPAERATARNPTSPPGERHG